ncbi:Ras GTPase-activating protein-binding protein 1 [Entomortierella parvispora]|uniref:Ras GTPase-activating protein-binding protein 1 n=1 Tax=Entomortierella parvispora TaxID=205924 RepID=A0A9P3HLY1_9FUNG|nr:Ras GTPase-activating protein-binding protein 1 [Entomortierella parvispora]
MAATDANTPSAPEGASPATSVNPLEVGMAFVHEFYTFLNKEPLRLHLFYKKNSTLSHGFQGEDAIKTKIAGLEFDDCRVLVSNVDCQESFGNGIIIQVLGELSNKGGPAQKFVQTFFLAEQHGGFYVLNDLFRYLKEDLDDEEDEEEAIASLENHADPTHAVIASQDIHDQAPISEEKPVLQAAVEASAPATDLTAATEETVTRTQVQEIQAPVAPLTQVTSGETKKTGEKKTAERKTEKKTTEKKTEKKATDKKDTKADDSIQEKPEAVNPSDSTKSITQEPVKDSAENAVPAATSAPAPAPAAPQPPKANTWATLAAKNSTQWGTQVAAAKAGAVTAPVTAPSAPSSATKVQAPSQASQSPRPQSSRPNGREEYHSIYIKNVTERMSLEQLKDAFSKFGHITHLEYTQKRNCAFMDFSTADSMNAALKQNTVPVGNEVVLAEERRRNSNNANGGPRAFNSHQGGGPQSHGQNGPRGGGGNRANNARGGGPSDRKPMQGNQNKAEKPTTAVAAK